MTGHHRSTAPVALHGPVTPDRFMAGLRVAVRGYAAISSRARIPEPTPVDRVLRLIVTENRPAGGDIRTLTLESADGSDLPPWYPGAHIDVTLPSGATRQYSLCGNHLDSRTYRIAVRRTPGGSASNEIHDRVPAGTRITAGGPRNAFPFAYPHLARARISKVVFIAAGIGITPILPMVRAAASAHVNWHLTYVGRDTGTMAFLDEIENLDQQRVRIITGRRRTAQALLAEAGPGASVYLCGPPEMLDDIRAGFDTTGAAGLHFERFSAPPVVGGRPFHMRLAATGTTVTVGADQSALAAVREAGVSAAYSCRQGFCGTCRVRVLDGDVERRGRSPFLDSSDTMLVCTDRALASHLSIDL